MGLRSCRQPRTLRPLVYVPYGDSITYGSNASPLATARWSTLVRDAITKQCARRALEINEGFLGENVVDTLNPALDSRVLVHNPELIILAGGLNDMRKGTAIGTFETAYNAMVAEAVAYSSVNWVVCCSLVHMTAYSSFAPYDQGDDTDNHTYNSSISTIASNNGASFADVHTGMDHTDALVDTDGVHPNNAGHANIAATIIPVVVAAINGS